MAARLRPFRLSRSTLVRARSGAPGRPEAVRQASAAAVLGLAIGLVLGLGAEPAAADHFLTHPAPAQQAAASGPSISIKALTAGADATVFVAARAAAPAAPGEPSAEPSGRPPHDAALLIAPGYVPDDDVLLGAYSADPKTRRAVGLQASGLLGIAAQAWRARHAEDRARGRARKLGTAGSDGAGEGEGAYSLADAMRDAIWRRETAAKLRETLQ